MSTHTPQYRLERIRKTFPGPAEPLTVLDGVSLTVGRGESLAIVGASGSGKSTLLHMMGTLDTPTSGTVLLDGVDLARLSDREKASIRRSKLGFVFQFHHLLPEFTALENVAMQAMIAGRPKDEAMAMAEAALGRVGLGRRAGFGVTVLSGGERQRAAIARAILPRPQILLADEPTGNLDERNGAAIAELLLDLNHADAMTLITVTHNPDLADTMGRRLELKAGAIHENLP